MEWSGGWKWDNCNSIINKYIFLKSRGFSPAVHESKRCAPAGLDESKRPCANCRFIRATKQGGSRCEKYPQTTTKDSKDFNARKLVLPMTSDLARGL